MRSILQNNEGFAAMIGAVISILVAIIISVLIYYRIAGSMMAGVGSGPSTIAQKALYNTTNSTADTVFTLAPIIAIVAIAGVILMIVTNFGRGSGA